MQSEMFDSEGQERLTGIGAEFYTELTTQYIDDLPEATVVDIESSVEFTKLRFKYDTSTLEVLVHTLYPANTFASKLNLGFEQFQENVSWIIKTCADYGLGIDIEVDNQTGQCELDIFLRIFWAGYNFEVMTSACDNIHRCRGELQARIGI